MLSYSIAWCFFFLPYILQKIFSSSSELSAVTHLVAYPNPVGGMVPLW